MKMTGIAGMSYRRIWRAALRETAAHVGFAKRTKLYNYKEIMSINIPTLLKTDNVEIKRQIYHG